MLIAILGMTGWLLYAHQLIERKTAKSQRMLYSLPYLHYLLLHF